MSPKKHRSNLAYKEGQEAVRRKPYNSPVNPYDSETDPVLHRRWEDGATSAGWNEIYTNGILNESDR